MHEHTRHSEKRNQKLEMASDPVRLYDRACVPDESFVLPDSEIRSIIFLSAIGRFPPVPGLEVIP